MSNIYYWRIFAEAIRSCWSLKRGSRLDHQRDPGTAPLQAKDYLWFDLWPELRITFMQTLGFSTSFVMLQNRWPKKYTILEQRSIADTKCFYRVSILFTQTHTVDWLDYCKIFGWSKVMICLDFKSHLSSYSFVFIRLFLQMMHEYFVPKQITFTNS